MGIARPITIALALALWFNSTCKGENKGVRAMKKCSVCNKEMSIHAISGEETCFVHGNPDGSQFEREIFWKLQGEILGTMVGEC